MKCSICATENQEDAIYCKKCGQRLIIKKVCPACDAENEVDSLFCVKCGSSMEKKKGVVIKNTFVNNTNKSKLCSTFNKIATSLLLASIVLLFIGSFLNVLKKGTGFYNINKVIDMIRDCRLSKVSNDELVMCLFTIVIPGSICMLAMVSNMIVSSIALILGLIRGIDNLVSNNYDKGIVKYAMMPVLTTLFTVVFCLLFSYSVGKVNAYHIISLIFTFSTMITLFVFKWILSENKKAVLVNNIFASFELCILSLLLIFLVKDHIELFYSTGTIPQMFVALLDACFLWYGKIPSVFAGDFVFSSMLYVILILLVILLVLTIYKRLKAMADFKNNTKAKLSSSILAFIGFVLYFVFVLVHKQITKIFYGYEIEFSLIMLLVLSISYFVKSIVWKSITVAKN